MKRAFSFICLEKAIACIDAFGELAEMDKKMDEVYFQELMKRFAQ